MDKKDKVFIIIACILFFTLLCTGGTAVHYKNKYDRLVEQNRVELELIRRRAATFSTIIEGVRTEVGELGESLSRQRNSITELRELLTEVRTRFEKMEKLLSSPRNNDCNLYSGDSCINSSDGE